MYLKFIIVFFGLAGFSLAFYIFIKKRGKKQLVCPLRSNCDKVIRSDYSKAMGIPIEILGMLYYTFIVFSYVSIINGFASPYFNPVLFYISGFAMLFSFYLISIQAFVIRQWCVWCISSAFISTLIFFSAYLIKFVV
jgi:uncharacterized membrane protein